ncbi:MAG: hypothetical protein ACRC20_03015 [Segniliparus sp.]|uniref:hypothetical protein n=1 Tax=Segniliparus sp. TaxID=2804064 RepID=UPI003F2DF408
MVRHRILKKVKGFAKKGLEHVLWICFVLAMPVSLAWNFWKWIPPLAQEALLVFLAIALGSTLLESAIWAIPFPNDHLAWEKFTTWNKRKLQANLAALGHEEKPEEHRRAQDSQFMPYEDIARHVAQGKRGERAFHKAVRVPQRLGSLYINPLASPFKPLRRALKSPAPWLITVCVVLIRHPAEQKKFLSSGKSWLHWAAERNLLTSTPAVITILVVALGWVGWRRVEGLRAREEAVKAANTDLLALGGELARLALALGKYTEHLTRWRHRTLDNWVRGATNGQYCWEFGGVQESQSFGIPHFGTSPSADEVHACAHAVLARSNAITAQGTDTVCRGLTLPVLFEAEELSLFQLKPVCAEDRVYKDLFLEFAQPDYSKELQREFSRECPLPPPRKQRHPYDYTPRYRKEPQGKAAKERNAEVRETYERALVEHVFHMLHRLDNHIVNLETARHNAEQVAHHLHRRVIRRSTDQAFYKAVRG